MEDEVINPFLEDDDFFEDGEFRLPYLSTAGFISSPFAEGVKVSGVGALPDLETFTLPTLPSVEKFEPPSSYEEELPVTIAKPDESLTELMARLESDLDEDELQWDEESWGFEELDENVVNENSAFEDIPMVEEETVEDNFTVPEEAPSEDTYELNDLLKETEATDEDSLSFKEKMAVLWAQIMGELRGEDEPKRSKESSNIKPILAKIGKPYIWLAEKIMGGLNFLLKPLQNVNIFHRVLGPKSPAIKIIAYLLPLVAILLILSWLGNRPLAAPPTLQFPDGGKSTISTFAYDEKNHSVTAIIDNEGDVIAQVRPTVQVYSIQHSLNPLSFFFAKPNKPCMGKITHVNIGKTQKVTINCPIEGSAKKFMAKLTWMG